MWLFSFFCFFGRHQERLFVCHVGSHPPSFFLDGYQKHISGPRLLRCKGRTVCFTVASYDRVSEPACLMHLCRAFLRRSFHLWAVRSLGAFSANTRSRRMSRKVLSSACGRCDRHPVFSPSWQPCLCWCFHQPFPFGFVPFKRLPSLVSMQTCSVHRNVCSHYACFGHTRER